MFSLGRIPFAFLEDIHQRFVRTYGRAVHSAQAYGMNDEFSRVLSQQMEYYSNDPNADRINRLKGEMSQVRNVMIENIDKVLERGDRLELLVDKTANMQGNTFRFRKQARRFRSTVWWRNVKLTNVTLVLLIEECMLQGCADIPPPGDHLCYTGICLPWASTTFLLEVRGSVVLAEFSAASTNASAIARQILEKIPGNNDSHVSYSQDRFIFHVKRTDGLSVLCMADDTAGRRIPFAFLEDIHQRFVRTYGRAVHSAQAYGMNDEFSRVLSQQMEYYSNDPNADRINRLKGEMSQVRNVMIENIDKVLERGDRLELLVDKTANMQGNTFRFRKQARRFRSTVWWRNVKLTYVV
ncbi:hypothetical protein L1049_013929 [Liquidambar formosana]|uniref:Uncharacterized protein n=1 Tax=Liquidambar formosana TaxID=63359 RepID=A0AAP0RL97_LIQFO